MGGNITVRGICKKLAPMGGLAAEDAIWCRAYEDAAIILSPLSPILE